MKLFTNKLPVLIAIVAGIFVTPGLVIFAWGFQIYSYTRLAKTSLYLFPVTVIISLVCCYFLQAELNGKNQKQAILNLSISILFSLMVTRFSFDLPHYLITLFFISILFFFVGSIFIMLARKVLHPVIDKVYTAVFSLFGLVGLSVFVYMSFFVRIYGDDFCFANMIGKAGLFNTLSNFYLTWSGRVFTDIFMLGFTSYRFLPLIQIALLLLVTFLVLRQLIINQTKTASMWAIFTAMFLLFSLFSVTPDPYKSIYWMASSTTVFPVSILFILLIGYMAKGFLKGFGKKRISIILAFLLALVVSTGHEITIPAILLVITLFLLFAFWRRKQDGLLPFHVTLSALAGAVAGSLILVLAPGNYVRMAAQNYPSTPGIISAIGVSIGFYTIFLEKLAENWGWLMLVAVLISGLMSKTILPRNWKIFGVIAFVTILASWGTFLVSAFAISEKLPQRTQFIPTLYLIVGFFSLGAVFPLSKIRINPIFPSTIVLLLLGFVFIQVLVTDVKMVAPMQQFAENWDRRDQLLRTTDTAAYTIDIPWDSKEQQYYCLNEYYSK